jgi:hypothetical protein
MAGEVALVEFPAGAVDIDTPADLHSNLDGLPVVSAET